MCRIAVRALPSSRRRAELGVTLQPGSHTTLDRRFLCLPDIEIFTNFSGPGSDRGIRSPQPSPWRSTRWSREFAGWWSGQAPWRRRKRFDL